MEDTLRVKGLLFNSEDGVGPNPCSNGRYSTSESIKGFKREIDASPNPCSNGRYSTRESDIFDESNLFAS